jgi:elongation of very long chain fatty acids protein 6
MQKVLISWNLLLSVFSIAGAWRLAPIVFRYYYDNNFLASKEATIELPCNSKYLGEYSDMGFWMFVFAVSKVAELGDTLFLMLRKQKLIFLHWFHHMSVLLFTWHSLATFNASISVPLVANFIVHAIMYPYYFLAACGVKLPRSFAMGITGIQIIQMFNGIAWVSAVIYLQYTGLRPKCEVTMDSIALTTFCYVTYLVLFMNYFKCRYIRSMPKRIESARRFSVGQVDRAISTLAGNIKKDN